MKRSRLPGASRGLGRGKPHVELDKGVWHAFNIVRADGVNHPFIGAEIIQRVGKGHTWLGALREWLDPPLLGKLDSAVDMLRCIAAMGKKAGSESAKNWLLSHNYPLEPGGYVPGKGFTEL